MNTFTYDIQLYTTVAHILSQLSGFISRHYILFNNKYTTYIYFILFPLLIVFTYHVFYTT